MEIWLVFTINAIITLLFANTLRLIVDRVIFIRVQPWSFSLIGSALCLLWAITTWGIFYYLVGESDSSSGFHSAMKLYIPIQHNHAFFVLHNTLVELSIILKLKFLQPPFTVALITGLFSGLLLGLASSNMRKAQQKFSVSTMRVICLGLGYIIFFVGITYVIFDQALLLVHRYAG